MSLNVQRGVRNRSKTKKRRRKSVYEQQREEETIRNATTRGYLRRMTIEFLSENVGLNDCDLPTIGYLNVTKLQLNSVGALEMCINLRICILPGNYITSFDALINCVNLNMLDLHSNQIKKVPNDTFWATLKNLQILYLHDNSISSLGTIHSLGFSSSILVLTLYNTPLSLKKNYRHHLVNGIWSLKALDNHVISDEEIIEDLTMSQQFSSMNNKLKIDLNHGLTKASSLEQAVEYFKGVITKVNKIQAKFSPVLVIQKTIRGYLARRRFKHIMSTRTWAATTIQQFYRFKKGLTQPKCTLPTPSSPLYSDDSEHSRPSSQDYVGDRMPKFKKRDTILPDISLLRVSSERIETILEEGSVKDIANSELGNRFRSKGAQDGRVKVKKHMTVDLSKLSESPAWEPLDSNSNREVPQLSKVTILSSLSEEKNTGGRKVPDKHLKKSVPRKSEEILEKKESIHPKVVLDGTRVVEKEHRKKPEKIGKYPTVRVFLGAVAERTVDKSGFLMHGHLPPQQKNDPVVDMLLTKQELGRAVRKSRENEKSMLKKKKEVPVIKDAEKVTNDQKLFMRTHGTMGLACLRAVQQAYRDQKLADEKANRIEKVAEMKERRDEMANKLQLMKMDYQENILTDRIQDGVFIAEALQGNEMKQAEEQKKVALRRLDAVTKEREHKAEWQFIQDFSRQQVSVSHALRSHDRAEIKKHKLEKLTEFARQERETNLKQRALVKRYMEHCQLRQQADVAEARAALNIWMAATARSQLLEAEEHVKKRKNSMDKTKELKTLPPFNAQAEDLAIMFPGKGLIGKESPARNTNSCFDKTSSEPCLRDSSQLMS